MDQTELLLYSNCRADVVPIPKQEIIVAPEQASPPTETQQDVWSKVGC